MKDLILKVRLIFIPFLIIAVSTICGYLFLYWVLIIELNIFSVKKEITEFWIPFCIAGIPLIIWLRPRINLLGISKPKTIYRYKHIPYLFGIIAIWLPCWIGSSYIEKSTGELTKLDSISQINQQPPTKYYSLKNCFIDKKNIWNSNIANQTGRHNESFSMKIFIVAPIRDNTSDTNKNSCSAWFPANYSETINNPGSDSARDRCFHEFFLRNMHTFYLHYFGNFIYMERNKKDDDYDYYKEAIKTNPKVFSTEAPILYPVNEPFETRTGHGFMWIFLSFGICTINWFLMLLVPRLNPEKLAKFREGKPEGKNDFKEALAFFLPRKDFFITPILIDLNILIFLIMVFLGLGFISFKSSDLLTWGADYRPYTINGEWWRMLTSIFLHGGLMHVVANMIGLLFVGIILEPKLGRMRFSIVYLVTGILASAASLWWHKATVSVGASGAIFGLYGVFLALLLTRVFPKDFSKSFLTTTLIFVGYNLVFGLTGGIDNAAHIGGLLSGFIIGFVLSMTMEKTGKDIKAL